MARGIHTESVDGARHCRPGLLPIVLMAKFADHISLYRQSMIYVREGVELERALLAHWVEGASALLRPLADMIRRHLVSEVSLESVFWR